MIFLKGFLKRKLVKTSSPSIDILISSNFERFLYSLMKDEFFFKDDQIKIFYEDLKKKKKFVLSDEMINLVKDNIKSGYCEEKFVEDVIMDTFLKYKVVIDPHTAIGLKVAQDYLKKNDIENKKKIPLLLASTAHWSKFASIIDNSIFNGETYNECDKNDLLLPEFLFKKFEKFEGFDKKRNKIHFGIECLKDKKITQNNELEPNKVVIEDKILEFLNNL